MKNVNPLGLFDDHFLMEKLTKLGTHSKSSTIILIGIYLKHPWTGPSVMSQKISQKAAGHLSINY